MSDSETEDIVDNVNNESVDWGCAVEVPVTEVEEKIHEPQSNLYTIQEESYLSTVASRPRSIVPTGVSTATLDKNASRSFTDECLASSFGGANMTSNSAEFCRNADSVKQLMEAEQEAFDLSGRRLEIPCGFTAGAYSVENNSWDKGPHQWETKQTAPSQPAKSTSSPEQPRLVEVVKSNMDNTQKNSPEAPVTPAKNRKFETKITPVRPAQERVTALRDRNSPRLSAVTTTSTPKGSERGTSRLPDWEVSAINANNTTAANNTTGVDMPSDLMSNVFANLPPNAPPHEVMAEVERLRCARLQKASQRAEARQKFCSDTVSSRTEERKITTLGQRNLDRKPSVNPVSRLPTVEEERMESSRASSRSNSRPSETNAESRRSSDPLMHTATSHLPADTFQSRAPSQAMSRASSTMSLYKTDTRMSSSSSRDGSLRITGTTGKLLAFGSCEQGLELVKTITLTNLSDRAIRVTAELSKGEKSGYRILEGRQNNVRPKESAQLRIEFKPHSSARHNNTLSIQSNTPYNKYTIQLRGLGGTASLRMLRNNENIQVTHSGQYVIKKNALHGSYGFQLKSDGAMAFCKVSVTCDGQPVQARVLPSPYVVLKTGQKQEFTVEISSSEAAKLKCLPIMNKENPFVGFEIIFYWGDEYFRQRAMEYLKKKGEYTTGHFSVAEQYLNAKTFIEPNDYPCNQSDLVMFETGLHYETVRVISSQPRLSSVSMQHHMESTLKPDDTLACLMFHDRERTIVRDYNETTFMQ